MERTSRNTRTLYVIVAIMLVASLLLSNLVLMTTTATAGHGIVAVDAPSYAKVGQTVCFQSVSIPEADSCTWNFGDGTPVVVKNAGEVAEHHYTSTGVYTVQVCAKWGNIEQLATHEIMIGEGLLIYKQGTETAVPASEAWNVLGAKETFVVPDQYRTGNQWAFDCSSDEYANEGVYSKIRKWDLNPGLGLNGTGLDYWEAGGWPWSDHVVVGGALDIGELQIVARTNVDLNNDNKDDVLYGAKKWGKIDHTIISGPSSSQVIWYEDSKCWGGDGEVTEEVIGRFHRDCPDILHPADGAEVYWWLVDGQADLSSVDRYDAKESLIAEIDALPPAKHVVFTDTFTPRTQTVSGDAGEVGITKVNFHADGEESVKIVCLATYPTLGGIQFPVCPEFTAWNFWGQEMEKVPQVRWAGEKIVLEKQFGPSYAGNYVEFYLENQSPGTLESVAYKDSNGDIIPGGSSANVVGTFVDNDGIARCILHSESPGEVDVSCALYDTDEPWYVDEIHEGRLINQHGFVVFFLKMEEVTLGNVVGQRVDNPLTTEVEGHDSGIWFPENPSNPNTDVIDETLNTSEDTLLRARVKGWFMGDNKSWRPESFVDNNSNGVMDVGDTILPAGRWVLPDDWEYLAGPFWEDLRLMYDIMTQPDDDIMSEPDYDADKSEERGAYVQWGINPDNGNDVPATVVAEEPVIGPYNPLDVDPYSHFYVPEVNDAVGINSIIPNNELNWWDCPMPPAKIIFEILDNTPGNISRGQGYLKEVDKGDVYYKLVDLTKDTIGPDAIAYTNPYYEIMIPSSELIPPTINNGGYGWNSWDSSYGPYPMWDIFNQASSEDDPMHPTKVEIYSDNHGEAMVYLNGDWNYDISEWPVNQWGQPEWVLPNGAWHIPTGGIVGDSSVVAVADYPYLRKHTPVISNMVSKHWTWGQEKLVDVEQQINPQLSTEFGRKLVTVWVNDRDGFPDVDMQVDWRIQSPAAIEGFLSYTNGVITNPESSTATSYTRAVIDDPDDAVYDDIKRFADSFPWKFPPGMSKEDRYIMAKSIAPSYAVAGVYVTCSEGWVRTMDVILHRPQPNPDGSESSHTITHSVVDTSGSTLSGLDFGWSSRVDPEEPLTEGWNLVSYFGGYLSVEDALTSVIDRVDAVWTTTDDEEWLSWSPGVPEWVNTLDKMQSQKAYYIKVSEDCLWEY